METSDKYTLTLHYCRLREEKRDGEYPYRGHIDLVCGDKKISESFICWNYKKVIARLSELTNMHDVGAVFFQRTERDDILPVELGERIIDLIRKDPLEAYRAMLYEPAPTKQRGGVSVSQNLHGGRVAAGYDTLARAFGEEVYLRMVNGMIEDPETGEWAQMAYGPKFGWRIRREDNKPTGWIRVDMADEAPDGTSFAERIAFARWAKVNVHTLLEQQLERYYLPREWNEAGPWVDHDNLKKRLEQYLAERETAHAN